MTPSDSPVLDDDTTDWIADLRHRVDRIDITVPVLDDVLDRPVRTEGIVRRLRTGRPRLAGLAAAAAALALIVGATIVLTREQPTRVSTTPDRSDPLDGVVLLGPPPSATIAGVSVGPDPEIVDPDAYDGRIENYLGGSVGDQARLVSLMSAPSGAASPPFSLVTSANFSIAQWFADGLVGTPVGTDLTPIDVPGASRAFGVDLSAPLNGIDHRQVFVVAQTDGVDALLVGTGIALDELVSIAHRIHFSDRDATLQATPDGLSPIGSPDGDRRWSSAYEATTSVGTIVVTPLDDAAAAVAAIHGSALYSDPTGDPILVRGGPDWVLSTGRQSSDVYGVRDDMWVRVTTRPPDASPDGDVAAIDDLVPMTRTRFEKLRHDTLPARDAPGHVDSVRAAVGTKGNWLPTRLPDGARLRRISFTTGGGVPVVPGLPTLWNPTTGESIGFRNDAAPSGVVVRVEAPIGGLRAEVTRQATGTFAARLWPKPVGGVAIGVFAAVPTIERLDLLLHAVRWNPDTGWSIEVPPGWEAIPLSDQPATQSADDDGIYADLTVATVVVLRLDPVQRAAQLASVVSMGGTTRTIAGDGRTVYETTDGSGYASAYLPGADGVPDVIVSSERLRVDALVDVARSVQPVSDAAADAFFAPLKDR